MKYNDKWAISEFEPKTDVLWVQPGQDEEDEGIKINAFVNGKWRAVSGNGGENYPPEDGIPVTDLDDDVQSSLSKADTAYQKPTTGIPASDLASDVQTSLDKADTALQTIKTVNGQSLVGSGDIEILEPGTIETLVIDGTPTAGSSNLITSGGTASEIVWDVTARNSNATFASLSALLSNANLATLIPTDVRKGGMQIRFVLSSDKKYVQYFLTKNEWSASDADWEKMNLEDEVVELDENIRLRNESVSLVGEYESSLGSYCAGSLEIKTSTTTYYYLYRIPAHSYYTISQTSNAPGDTFVMSGIIGSLSDFIVGGKLSKALTIGNVKKNDPVTYYTENEILVVILGSSTNDNRYTTLYKKSTSVAAESVATIKPSVETIDKILFGSNIIGNFPNEGVYINTSGVKATSANHCATDYIPVVAGAKIELHNFRGAFSFVARAFFYDKNKEPISGSAVVSTTTDTQFVTVPTNACYAIFSTQFRDAGGVLYPQSTVVFESNINNGISDIHGEIGQFDVPFELGTVVFTSNTFDYRDDNTKARTERDKTFFLNKGDIIKLTDYTSARFMIAWKKVDGTWGGNSDWITSDVSVSENGFYIIIVGYQNGSAITNLSSLTSLVRVVCQRNNANLLSSFEDLKGETESSIEPLKLDVASAGNSSNLVDVLNFTRQGITNSGETYASTTRLLSSKIDSKEGRIAIDTSNATSNLHVLRMAFDGDRGSSSGWLTDKQIDFDVRPAYSYYIVIRKEGDATITLSDLEGVRIIYRDGDILSCNENVLANLANIRRPYHNYSSSTNYNNCLVLAHFSDVHADTENIRRISEFCSTYGGKIDDVIQTGDLIGANLSDGIPSNWSALGNNILGVIGNHDAQNKVNNVWTTQPQKDSYDEVFAPFISNWGVTQPTDAAANGYCYYHKDYVGQKIRLISVDCMHWDATQKTWFEGVLASAITGELSVIVAMHYLPFALTHSETAFDSIDQPASSSIGDILANAEIADAVADFISNDGEFICYLTGHTHIDFCGVGSTAPYDNQICITIATASSSLSATVYGDTERLVGTKSQDCINITAFDTTSKTIKVYRIGVDHDRYLRTKNFMAWNYSTRQLIKMY